MHVMRDGRPPIPVAGPIPGEQHGKWAAPASLRENPGKPPEPGPADLAHDGVHVRTLKQLPSRAMRL
eukprot:5096175-Alexandrium_andersonii.AAC.1